MKNQLSLRKLPCGKSLLVLMVMWGGFFGICSAQIKNIKGTVTDTSGEPLIGVSIVEKGTSNGTVLTLSLFVPSNSVY